MFKPLPCENFPSLSQHPWHSCSPWIALTPHLGFSFSHLDGSLILLYVAIKKFQHLIDSFEVINYLCEAKNIQMEMKREIQLVIYMLSILFQRPVYLTVECMYLFK